MGSLVRLVWSVALVWFVRFVQLPGGRLAPVAGRQIRRV